MVDTMVGQEVLLYCAPVVYGTRQTAVRLLTQTKRSSTIGPTDGSMLRSP